MTAPSILRLFSKSDGRERCETPITPICPHVLTNRSIIVSDRSTIEVEASEPDYPVYLTVDGRDPVRIAIGKQGSE